MQISAKQYAIGLVSALEEQSETKAKEIIANFIKLLNANQDLKKTPTIIKYFNQIWEEKHNTLDAKIISSRKLSKELIENLITYLKNKTKKDEIILQQKIDKNILGGIIIKYKDKVLDASLKTNLNILKNKLSE